MRLFRRKKTPPTFTPPPAEYPPFTAPMAPERDICVVGDLHGCIQHLERMLDHIAALPTRPQVVFVGDYVDRGEDSKAVLMRLMDITDDANVICLAGNHEDMMLKFLDDPAENDRWIRYGGLQTLASYGISGVVERPSAEDAAQIARKFGDALGPDTIQWLRARPVLSQNGNIAVVHAGADPRLPMGEQDPSTLKWGHGAFARRPRTDGVWVVHGHTIVDGIETISGRVGVDTGAYATGILSAILIRPDGSFDRITTTS